MRKNKDSVLITHILESMQNIELFIQKKTLSDFKNDRFFQSAVVRELLIVGEAAANLSDSFKEAHPKVPFHKIIGMRNILVHAYWEIDDAIVWKACKRSLPELKKKLEKTLQ